MRRRLTCCLLQLLGLLIVFFGTANFLPIFTGTSWQEGISSITLLVISWVIGGRMILKPEKFLGFGKSS
ncbi:MAG: hypothetical protein VXW84_13845 [Verrucomicrobiota bacterium]|nr:hypothetical protein [Verrucomicrobiota bacterium]